jgi:murein DD-endopeptidase MepM/ murein hydrolase activator NlpD
VLEFPLDCVLGQTCYIEDYVDLNPGNGITDYRCGLKTREGHKGTDIGLLSVQQMMRGVDVLAATAGKVRAIRDGVPDRPIHDQNRSSVAGKECGNAVALRHEDGWETRYCHLKNGSIRKRPGDIVQPGDVLGQVGMSGLSNFPHLHLSVSKDGKTVDPFVPETATGCSQDVQNGLWRAAPAYSPAGLFAVGFPPTSQALTMLNRGRRGCLS